MFIKIKRLGQTVDFFNDTGGKKNSNETVSCQHCPEVALATIWRSGDRLSNQTVYSQPATRSLNKRTFQVRCSQVLFRLKNKEGKKVCSRSYDWAHYAETRSPNSGKGYFRTMLAGNRFVVVLSAIMVYCIADLGRGLQYSTPLLPYISRLQLL